MGVLSAIPPLIQWGLYHTRKWGKRNHSWLHNYISGNVCGGGVIEKHNLFHVTGLRSPLYSLRQHSKLPNCGYTGDNEGTHMWFLSFSLTVNDRVEKLVSYESMGIP